MRNEDMSNLNSNADAQDSEETIANNQDAGRAPVVIRPGAIRVEADANGMVALPPEVALGDIAVVGTDLVIELPDGTQWVIVDGAVFVPQLMIGDVEVPPTNLAALLIGEEPEPAAGQNQSSGGNFTVAVPDLGPPQPLGDLLPPTALDYTPPEPDLAGQFLEPEEPDNIPDIVIETENNPTGAVNATADVNESGLPAGPGLDGARGPDESEGSAASGDGETTTGTFVYFSPDTPNVLAVDGLVVNGVVVTGPGQVIEGQYGFLTIIATRDGEIDFEYTLTDNTNGDNTSDDFSVTVTDADGDTATATLSINIFDDVPVARDDTDYIAPGGMAADGNVMTGQGTTSGNAGADTEGADGATVVDASGDGSTSMVGGAFVVVGMYGTLTLNADGSYTYARDPLSKGGVEDVFTYTLEDGDGDQSTATLTIEIDNLGDSIDINPDPNGGDTVDESGLPAGPGVDNDRDPDEPEGTQEPTNVETATGTITWVDGDGINVIRINDVIVTGPGQEIEVEGGILTIISYDPDANVIEYSYTLTDNTSGDDTSISFTVTVTDADGDVASDTVTIKIVDDEPVANDDVVNVAPADQNDPVVVDVFANDVEGADGVELSTIQYVDGTLSGSGTLVNNGDGTFTYTPSAGEEGTVTFEYSIEDGDGDVDTALVTINLPADDTPVAGRADALAADEDSLGGANNDEGQMAPDPVEVDHMEALSGTVSVTFGADVPADLMDSFAFLDANEAALDAAGWTSAGDPITWTVSADGHTLTGSAGGSAVIIVSLDSATLTDAATGEVTYGYSVELLDVVDHIDSDLEDTLSFNVSFNVSDSDGDMLAGNPSFSVSVYDDVHSAGDADVSQANENAPVYIDITTDLEEGADGVDLADVTVSWGTGDQSNLSYNAVTGVFTYTPTPGEEGTVSFSYTIYDGDGDAITRDVSFDLTDSQVRVGPVGDVTVDEDGLNAGDEAGEVDPNDDSNPLQSTPQEFAGAGVDQASNTIVVEFGGDVPGDLMGAFSFINVGALNGVYTQNGEDIVFSLSGDGDTIVGQVNGAGDPVITIAITGAVEGANGQVTYTYTVDLDGPMDQLDGNNDEGGLTFDVDFRVTEDQGETPEDFAEGSFSVTVEDDVHTVGDANVSQANENADVIIDITNGLVEGADGVDLSEVTYQVTTAGLGTLSYDGNGTFTYDPAAGEVGTVVFNYTVYDNDGDYVTKEVTLNLADGVPVINGLDDVYVDEDGVTGANADGAPQDPTETAGNGLAQNGDTFTVDFKSDVPANLDDAVVLLDDASYDNVFTQGGQPIEFDLIGGELVGRVNGAGDPVITISIDFVSETGGVATYTYTVLLEGPIDHGDTSTEDFASDLGSALTVYIEATDSDFSTVGGNFDVDVLDDVQTLDVFATDGTAGNQVATTSDQDIPDGFDLLNLNTLLNYSVVESLDGPGSETATYSLTVAIAPTLESGLTSGGQDIYLTASNDGTVVVGTTGANGTGTTIFSLTLSGSVVTLEQFHEIDHDANLDSLTLPTGLIGARLDVNVTDGDGDVADDFATVDLGGNIVFLDDMPMAMNDTDTATEGDTTLATGNVLYDNYAGPNGNTDIGDADNGADNGNADDTQLFVVNATTGGGDAVDNGAAFDFTGGPITLTGTYGELTLYENGYYEYELFDNATVQALAPGQQEVDQFTYTMRDFDGDRDAAVLTITVTGTNDAPVPTASAVIISEEGLNGANPDTLPTTAPSTGDDATTDNTNATFAAGQLTATDADGDDVDYSFAFAGNSPIDSGYNAADGTAIYWQPVTEALGVQTLRGTYGENGADVIVFVLDMETGDWSAQLYGPIEHPGAGEGTAGEVVEQNIVVDVNATDGYTSVGTTITAAVEDDSPEVGAGSPGTAPALQTDDTTLGTNTADYSNSFDIAFGADGEDGTPDDGVEYVLNTAGGDSGLTSGGATVYLYKIGDNIVASTSAVVGTVDNTNTVFTLSIDNDPTSLTFGVVTMDQDLAVDHLPNGNPASHNEAISLANIANLITLTATATDEDGDYASHTLDITGDISILDDGPDVEVSTLGEGAVTVQTSDADIVDTETSTTSLLSAISIDVSDFGADGMGSLTDAWTVNVVGYDGTNGVDSGIDVAGGGNVYLHEVGGFVIASTEQDIANVDNANYVFVIGLDTSDGMDEGKITVTQHQALDHTSMEPIVLANNLVQVTYTATIIDGDNDVDQDGVVIDLGGNISFADDNPDSVAIGANNSITLDESPLSGDGIHTDTVSFAGSFATPVDYGADGAGSVTYSFEIADGGVNGVFSGLYALNDTSTTQGDAIYLYNVGGTIVGSTAANAGLIDAGVNGNVYFLLDVNNSGDVTFTRTQNIWHGNTASNDETGTLVLSGGDTFRLVQTVTDADNDSDSSFVDLNGQFAIQDDGPSAFDSEDAPDIQNDATGGATDLELDINADISTYLGTDGGTVRFPDSLDGTDSGMDAGGVDIIWNVSADGQTLTGVAGSDTIITISLDQANSTYDIVLDGAVDAFTFFNTEDGGFISEGSNNEWYAIRPTGDAAGNDVLYTPIAGGGSSINLNADVGGVDSNFVTDGLGMRLDFVNDLVGSPVGNNYTQGVNNNHSFSGHYETNGVGVTMRQTTDSVVRFQAFDDNDGDNIVGDGVLDTVSGIIISYDGASSMMLTPTNVWQSVSVGGNTFTYRLDTDGKSVIVDGIRGDTGNPQPGDAETTVSVFTDSGYTSLEFENIDGYNGVGSASGAGSVSGDKFKYSGLSFQIPSTDPVDFSVPIQIIDGDGDTVAGADLDFSLVNSGGATTMAFEKIALDAANDDFVMAELNESQSLMMSSAIALGFAATLPAKFSWGDAGIAEAAVMDLAAYDVPSFTSDFGSVDAVSGVTGFEGGVIGSSSDALSGQTTFVAAKEAIDVSLDAIELPVEAPSAPKADTVAVAEKIAIVDAGEVILPGAEALAAMIAKDAGSVDLAVVAKEALVDMEGGEVDALLAKFGSDDAGAPDAVATLMVVGKEAIGTDDGGYVSANFDALLTDAANMHQDAAIAVVNG